MRIAGIGGGGMQRRGTTGGMSRRRGRGRVKGLDLRRDPRSEQPEENGGDGRVRVEAGGWSTMEAAVREGESSRSRGGDRRKKVG
jgi:hypothetical protein